MDDRLRAGQPAPRAGDYEVVTRDGDRTGIYRRGLKGRPLPPTPRKGQSYIYVGRRRATPQ
ncbi:MAG: hypothetical protein U9R79_17745 [Armatimonadota bacterium]|nr:hypothetical protein [Armatimonadota bacterium]